MIYLRTNYDLMLVGDLYHWERDGEGQLHVMPNWEGSQQEKGEV